LRGEGPADLVELSIELAAEMVALAGRATTLEQARELCERTIHDGSALERFRRVVIAQGGDPRTIDDPSRLPTAHHRVELPSLRAGFVQGLAARQVGHATMLLGAGRARVDSLIDPAVGILLQKKMGDPVEVGEPLATVLYNDDRMLDTALTSIRVAY